MPRKAKNRQFESALPSCSQTCMMRFSPQILADLMAARIIRILIWLCLAACAFWIINAVVSMIWYVFR